MPSGFCRPLWMSRGRGPRSDVWVVTGEMVEEGAGQRLEEVSIKEKDFFLSLCVWDCETDRPPPAHYLLLIGRQAIILCQHNSRVPAHNLTAIFSISLSPPLCLLSCTLLSSLILSLLLSPQSMETTCNGRVIWSERPKLEEIEYIYTIADSVCFPFSQEWLSHEATVNLNTHTMGLRNAHNTSSILL